MLLLHLLSNPIQTWQKHITVVLFWTKKVGFKIIDVCFPCSDDVINLMIDFLTNVVPFLSYISKFLLFLAHFMKNYAIVEISTKKKIICDTGSINMRI